MEGYNVLFPIGFDAFGLPTENYAVKTGTHPRIITDENIKRFSNQLKKVGFSFDWNRVIDTTDEDYYKWTQWIFLKMFEKGLVFRDRTLVNYCPHCKVVLSNEDSQGGKCDICHSEVVQKSKDVWYLRITQYADKLLEGLKDVDYPDNVKQQQIHWIGKSKGAFVNFDVDGIDEKLEIYTTRPDTLFGVTFMVIAPEHPIIDKYADKITNMDEITAYRNECAKKTEFERTQLVKDKTGVRIQGLEGINPVNGVGNHRVGLTEENLQVKVIGIGVPTVVDAATIVHDSMAHLLEALEEAEQKEFLEEMISPHLHTMFVTPKDVDETVKYLSFTISEGLNMAFEEIGG